MIQPVVSIIVPVYKAEKLLPRCVDSILSQTFSQWELILVDDGSPDDSGVLCDKFAVQDTRIRVLHKENGGVSSARNFALDYATGKYITFIDADDYIRPQFLERMLSQTPADLVICGFDNVGADGFEPDTDNILLSNNPEAINKLVEIPYYLDTPWGKFFNRQIVKDNKLAFDQWLRLSEDTLYCYEYLSYCRTVSVISDKLYVYDGLWGGDSKYKLTYDELNYASGRVVSALNRLNEKFNTTIETRYKCFHLSKLKDLFTEYTDVDIYKLYIQSHKKIAYEDFMSDERLSPLTIGILTVDRLLRNGRVAECAQFMRSLNDFITKRPNIYPTFKQKWFYTVLFILGVKPTLFLMRTALKIK